MLSVSSSQPADKPAPKDSSWASWLLIGIALAAVIALAVVNSTARARSLRHRYPLAKRRPLTWA